MQDMQGKRSACRGQHVTKPRDAAAISAGSTSASSLFARRSSGAHAASGPAPPAPLGGR
eukprot:CAMPEP_0177248092 /NCGR_PEP_ID=MMETSP0367-20130122/51968_1 /TAXON_ID=447022 ORGANISM="Scrippsiella hangoei-like, Strain SHHI-4" /NCGR_SAMPLE_ID=MMETSP0367 /ASSEMBLY_ACC=CAM_ASM_000362 /LENGTH=58 /DNA_ID=CAMNT_0018700375 /DNA_START=42 /DNA_END=214 /DNA_ORIENTATION=+